MKKKLIFSPTSFFLQGLVVVFLVLLVPAPAHAFCTEDGACYDITYFNCYNLFDGVGAITVVVTPTYSEAAYYSEGTYAPGYSEAGYYSEATYYSQGTYVPGYSESAYYAEGAYVPAGPADLTTTNSNVVTSSGQVTPLTWSITNAGGSTVSTAYTNYFWIDTDATHTTDTATWGSLLPVGGIAGPYIWAGGTLSGTQNWTAPTVSSPTTYYYQFCADWTNTVPEANEANNCTSGGWKTITINPSGGPDLTADAVPTTSTDYGVSKTFTTTVRNIGTGTTGVGFYNLLQKANDAGGSGASDINSNLVSALIGGGTQSLSMSHIFPVGDIGTKYIRFCADKQSAGAVGSIGEANESNNCGAWTAVTVTNPLATAPTITFTGSPTSVTSGGSSTLTWSSTNATSCIGSGFSTGNATSGSVSTGALVTTTNYGLFCVGPGGTTNATPVTITVAGACGTPALTFTAAPNRVQVGGSATLTWSVTNTSAACTITGPGVNMTTAAPTSCTIPTANQVVTNITGQSTYTLTCGSVTKTVIVNVVPKFEEF